jgi:hypothetical protein
MRVSAAFSVITLIIFSLALEASAQTAPGYRQGDTNIEIFRVPKPGRRPPPRKKIMAPLLSLTWWLMIRNRDCRAQEVDPNAFFATDDQLRIGATVNQSGRLYILLHAQNSKEAILIYPEPRINLGRNQVTRNMEIFVPYRCHGAPERDKNCPPDIDPSLDCWWNITKPYGEKYVTLIFSRQEIEELEGLLKRAGADPQGSVDLPRLSLDSLNRIKALAVRREDLKVERFNPKPNEKGFIAANFLTRVTNLNSRDNEEIIETITLKHQKR